MYYSKKNTLIKKIIIGIVFAIALVTILIYIGTSTKSTKKEEKITYKVNLEYQNGGIFYK